MQPGRSQLFESLKVYLNKSNRQQPIIGLKSIIECVNLGEWNREPLYWCEVCVSQLSKADIRNHILGSHHRFNYIKVWHPHLVSGWQEKSYLSEMAWPLMEIANRVERDEGPGDAQLLEVKDAVFQKIATQSENDAAPLVELLIDAQGETERFPGYTTLHPTDQSQTKLLLRQNQHELLQDRKSHRISSVKSGDWLKSVSTSQFYYPEALGEINNLLDDYIGAKPLIGLNCVVEYKSEDGYSKCFLCHCCRIRSDQKDVIDHMTSPSHLFNYLTETHPKQVKEMRGDILNNDQFLQSLAREVEQEEGRGDLKVVNVPESVCRLLTAKSYHWCIQMLHSEWTRSTFQNKKLTQKGSRVMETYGSGRPQKHTANPYKWEKREPKKKRKMKKTDTVFNVSLPLTGGAVMVERTHSNKVSDPVISDLPIADWDLDPSQEVVYQDSDDHPGSFTVDPDEEDNLLSRSAQLQPDQYSEGQEADHRTPTRNLTVTLFSVNLDDNVTDCLHSNQLENGTEHQEEHEEQKYSKYHGAPETSNGFYYGCQNENSGLLSACHTDDWSLTVTQEGSGSELRYNSSLTMKKTENMSYSAVQHYEQRRLQSQNVAGHDTSWWRFDSVREEEPGLGDVMRGQRLSWFRSNSGGPTEPAVQSLQMKQRPVQTYMRFPVDPAAPQSYLEQSLPYQTGQTGHGFMWHPNHHVNFNNLRPIPNHTRVDTTQPNGFIQTDHAMCYGAPS